MGVTVLRSREIPAMTEPSVWVDDSAGYRQLFVEGQCVAAEDQDTLARAASFALAANGLSGKMVAWIGGGLCVGPRVFAPSGCTQDIYELEESFRDFAPEGTAFAAGDWRETIRGAYDVIVYDLGGDVPRGTLSNFLKPGGIILP